jgi:hypothetical protein
MWISMFFLRRGEMALRKGFEVIGRELLVEAWINGETQKSIAQRFGCGHSGANVAIADFIEEWTGKTVSARGEWATGQICGDARKEVAREALVAHRSSAQKDRGIRVRSARPAQHVAERFSRQIERALQTQVDGDGFTRRWVFPAENPKPRRLRAFFKNLFA